jgi:hypothetical protein
MNHCTDCGGSLSSSPSASRTRRRTSCLGV